ncbi:MAG: hypothetical protein GEU90_20430 [Gemmatimonas sp.]|nr:hypothetical protein [Gemmatimonas sp.]
MSNRPCEGIARIGGLFVIAVTLAPVTPTASSAQTTFDVFGAVSDSARGTPVPLATVELEGHGSTLTFDDGSYRFTGVEAGAYNLRVTAYGYLPASRTIIVESDLSIDVSLGSSPIVLDSLVVEPRVINIGGHVRDPANDFYIVDAELLTNRGHITHTNTHGRFRIERVLEDVPLRISVREFGYLPLDTAVTPVQGERYLFELQPDFLVEAMIAKEVERLEERHAPLFAPMFTSMNRDRLLDYVGSHTLRTILEFRYWRYLDRIRVVIVDGRRYSFTDDPVSELSHVLPEEIERIEFTGDRYNAFLHVYTRDFMQELIARRTTRIPEAAIFPSVPSRDN